jgi:hypothetical protein
MRLKKGHQRNSRCCACADFGLIFHGCPAPKGYFILGAADSECFRWLYSLECPKMGARGRTMGKITTVLALLLLFGGSALSQSPEPPPQAPAVKTEQQPDGALKAQSHTDNQAKGTSDSAAGEKESPSAGETKSQKPKEAANEASEFWTIRGRTLKITDSLLVGFTFLLFLATVALFFATRDLVEGADKNSEKQLRAYIGLHESEVTVFPFEGGGFAFIARAELKNYGQTPANDMTVKSNVKIDKLENVPYDDFPGLERGPPTIAFRDTSFQVNVGWPISEADWTAIRSRQKVVFFWGRVDYRDAFDRPHYFTFRLVSAQGKVGSQNILTMVPHAPGYDSD